MFSPIIHRYIFLFGITSLGWGMLFGAITTSVPQFILMINWLIEGNYKWKLNKLKDQRVFWLLISVYAMHLLGLIQTANTVAGLSDLRIKLPLFILPLVFFSSKPLDIKELKILLGLFVTGLVLSSFWCIYYYYSHTLIDLRKISRFMSHIRLGLFINMGICTMVYFIFNTNNFKVKVISILVIVYLLLFMLQFGLVTGLIMFFLVAFTFALYLIIKQSLRIKLIVFCSLLIGAFTGFWFLSAEWKASNYIDDSDENVARTRSLSGRPYYKINDNKYVENGFYVANNIQYEELVNGWSKLSTKTDDKQGNTVVWTLIRYMTSKGLTKDSLGLTQLTKDDVVNIENGITNYKYANASALRKRVKEFMWEYQSYQNGANPSGNTMLMRFEFWKAAIYVIKRNIWVGVGTGDAQMAFNKAYSRTKTKLSSEWRLRSHNQFLAITVSFGVLGLFVFMLSLFYPIIHLRKHVSGLYIAFFFIAIVSFLTEDTLESQSGVSFYAYFNTLFLWLAAESKKENEVV